LDTLAELSAPFFGLFLGTLLFSRVGAWIQAVASALQDEQGKSRLAALVLAVFLNSGPWLAAAVMYWAYYVLSAPHRSAWEWFFSAALAAFPIWIVVLLVLHLGVAGRK
jgi:hypothetical protein